MLDRMGLGLGMGMLTRSQRLVIGLFVLLLVDLIWVASSELTEYIFHEESFEKPFFTTYMKTSMFLLYLAGFLFWRPWLQQCRNQTAHHILLDQENEEESNFYEETTPLSDSTYVPLKYPEGERSSGTESDDSSVKSVRFSKLAEVRHLSETEASDALMARLSYQASVCAQEAVRRAANKLTVQQVAKLALVFCVLWFVGNYSYQAALASTEAGVVNILSSSSGLFTLLLASVFPSTANDRFTLSKLVAVCFSISGVVLVSLSDLKFESTVPLGAIWSVLGALFYAAYLVLLRRKVDHEEKMDLPMFFGFVGLFNLLLLWPGFLFLHFCKLETFEWPNRRQWMLLIINGLIGTVFSEFLWLWGCFLTSSLIATLALSLQIPMSMFADVVLKHVHYSSLFYIGTVPMILAFFAVSLLAHYENWDPVMEGLRRLFMSLCYRRTLIRLRDVDSEQTESLIINADVHEA